MESVIPNHGTGIGQPYYSGQEGSAGHFEFLKAYIFLSRYCLRDDIYDWVYSSIVCRPRSM